jgi:phosphatidylglycerophosphate synthase
MRRAADSLSLTSPILWALAPAIVLSLYFIVGLAVFAIRSATRGIPRDAETEKRGASLLVGFYLRHYYFWLTKPLFLAIVRAGISPIGLTYASALLGAASALAVGAGRFALGGWLFIFAGILDTFDGRLARTTNSTTSLGAAIDSVLDRYTDAFMLIGLAWYYRNSWVLLAVLATLLGSSIVPYVRARGEGLGVTIKNGLMPRLERVLILGSSVALSPILEAILSPEDPHPPHYLAIAGILLSAITTNTTAIVRTISLMRALERPSSSPRRIATKEARSTTRSERTV